MQYLTLAFISLLGLSSANPARSWGKYLDRCVSSIQILDGQVNAFQQHEGTHGVSSVSKAFSSFKHVLKKLRRSSHHLKDDSIPYSKKDQIKNFGDLIEKTCADTIAKAGEFAAVGKKEKVAHFLERAGKHSNKLAKELNPKIKNCDLIPTFNKFVNQALTGLQNNFNEYHPKSHYPGFGPVDDSFCPKSSSVASHTDSTVTVTASTATNTASGSASAPTNTGSASGSGDVTSTQTITSTVCPSDGPCHVTTILTVTDCSTTEKPKPTESEVTLTTTVCPSDGPCHHTTLVTLTSCDTEEPHPTAPSPAPVPEHSSAPAPAPENTSAPAPAPEHTSAPAPAPEHTSGPAPGPGPEHTSPAPVPAPTGTEGPIPGPVNAAAAIVAPVFMGMALLL